MRLAGRTEGIVLRDRLKLLITTWLVTLAVLAAPDRADAQSRRYTLDTDPVRLGDKALDAGDLAEATHRFEEAVTAGHRSQEAYLGLAVVATRQGRFETAEQRYRQAIAAGGKQEARARAGLGLILLRLDRRAEAGQEFERALDRDNDTWLAHYGRARLALMDDDPGKARQELAHGERTHGLAEGEDAYHHGLALLKLATGDLEAAGSAALLALHLNPTDPEHGALVAHIYTLQGTTPLAIQAYEQTLATPGVVPTAPMLHTLGNLYRQQQRFNEARDHYAQAVAADSTYAPVLEDLADLLHRARQWDPAARSYLRYLEASPNDTSAWLGLSESLRELGRHDQAADAATRVQRLDPTSEEGRLAFIRGGIRARQSEVRDQAARAMAELSTEVEWDGADLLALARWQTAQQQLPQAAATLERAAARSPDLYEVPFQQGVVALQAGQADAAVAAFARAAELAPDIAAIPLNQGIASYRAGNLDAAIPAFRRAVELDPESTTANLLLGQALAATGQIDAATAAYQQVLDREPDNAKAMRGLGFCRLRQSDYAGAVASYGAATEADPDHADGWSGLANAHLGLGNLDAAERAFARARTIDPKNVMLTRGAELLQQARDSRKETQSP